MSNDSGKIIDALHRFEGRVQTIPLKDGDGGGTSGGMSEDWKTDVERRLGELRDDIRTAGNRIIAAAIAGAIALAGLYFYIDSKTSGLDDRLRANEVAIASIKGDIAVANAKLDRLIEKAK